MQNYYPQSALDADNYWQTQQQARELILGNRYRQYLQQLSAEPLDIDAAVLGPVIDELSSFSTSPGQELRPWYRPMLLMTLQQLAPYLLVSSQRQDISRRQRAEQQLNVILRATWQRLLPILQQHLGCRELLTAALPDNLGHPDSPTVVGQNLLLSAQQMIDSVPNHRRALQTHAPFYRRLLRYSGWAALLDKGARRAAALGAAGLAESDWLQGITAYCYFYSQLTPAEIAEQELSAELLAASKLTIIELARC